MSIDNRHFPGCPHYRNAEQCAFVLSDEDSYDCCTCLKGFVSKRHLDFLQNLFNSAVRLLLYAGDASESGMEQGWKDEKNALLHHAKQFGFLAKEHEPSHGPTVPNVKEVEEKAYEAGLGRGRSEANFRIELWAHLVSRHAVIISPELSEAELFDLHKHEHDGPGTIRNHPREDLSFNLKKLGEVLSESEDDEPRCIRCKEPLSHKGLCRGEDRPHTPEQN